MILYDGRIRIELTREQASMLVQMLEYAKVHGLPKREQKKATAIGLILCNAILKQEPNPK